MTSNTVTVTKDGRYILTDKKFNFPKLSIVRDDNAALDNPAGRESVTIFAYVNGKSFFTRMHISEENELDPKLFASALRQIADKFSE